MKKVFKKIIVYILTFEAQMVLKKYKPKIVTITGSVGKTSTKDAVYTVLSRFFYTRKSAKSFNSELGVPLTILGCPSGWNNPFIWLKNIISSFFLIIFPHRYPKWLVLEVGADRPGDIQKVAKWISPDVAIFTRFSKVPVHIEFFENYQAVIKEKSSILKSLKKNGLLIYNGDDEDMAELKSGVYGRSISFGLGETAQIRADHQQISYEEGKPVGITFRIDHDGNSVPVTINNLVGEQHIYPVLAAFAVGVGLNLNLVQMSEAVLKYEPGAGRMRILKGIKETTIIDDTYNSSPVALEKALETLSEMETHGRKIAVIGDMLELGKHSVAEHKGAGELAVNSCDLLLTVGIRARDIAQGALIAGMPENNILQYEDSKMAGNELEKIIQKNDVVLIKGSQGIRMEKVVEEIMAEPEKKEKLLVRQEEEWKRR